MNFCPLYNFYKFNYIFTIKDQSNQRIILAGQRLIANFSTSQEPLEADQGEKCFIMLNMYLDSIRFTIIFTKKSKFYQCIKKLL